MKSPTVARAVLILSTFSFIAGCGDNLSDQIEAHRKNAELQEKLRQTELQQQEMEAKLLAMQRAEEEQERRKSLVKSYANHIGQQIIKNAGGGQDLIVSVKGSDYNRVDKRFEIDMVVSFNGSIIRSNNYLVSGRLTIDEDGSNPKFARASANQNYLDMEDRKLMLGILEAVAEGAANSKKK